MNRKSKLKINKGEEFKIAIKDIKDGDTIFYDQYKQALKMLGTIVKTSEIIQEKEQEDRNKNWQSEDYENNIIAFCGERGEGKSSAMCTFIKSLSNIDEEILDDMQIESESIKNTYFDEPIIIDPSQFDNVHNILDIVLAKIYEKFKEDYEKNEEISERRKEELLNQFQKVYRQVSMINNQSKMLDDEFDYEGNIGKLSKLGESTRLKTSLKKLLELYLEFRKNIGNGKKKGNHQIIIAIDDLDLCSANAYKMAEQIRKYLILPQIVIVMAVKIEQLELCVQERNLIDFEKVFKAYEKSNEDNNKNNSKIYGEIFGMAERYVSKLIPKARRIYLPKVQDLEKTDIIYQGSDNEDDKIWSSDDSEENSLVEKVLKLITEKTGMIFLSEESGTSYLLPDNLRDMVNWIVRLADMKTPSNKDEYLVNIQKFYELFEIGTLDKELYGELGNELKAMWKMDVVHTHVNAKKLLDRIEGELVNSDKITSCGEREIELFQVIKKLEYVKRKVFDYQKERKISNIKSLYTIKMNQLKEEGKLFDIKGFVNGYLWGDSFLTIMPRVKLENNSYLNRGRFEVRTIDLYNKISNELLWDGFVDRLEASRDGIIRVNNISQNLLYRKENVLLWILIGLFCNITSIEKQSDGIGKKIYQNDESIIYNNSNLRKEVEVSLENYIIGICNIDGLYNKINMKKLNIEQEEFCGVAADIKENNKEIIKCMKRIVANIDMALAIHEYCKEHNEYKESTDTKKERSKEIVNKLLKNIYDYFEKRNIKIGIPKEQFTELKLSDNITINIGAIYASLIECGKDNLQRKEKEEFEKLKNMFNNIFEEKSDVYNGNEKQRFSSYLKNITAENAKLNLEKMAGNILYLRKGNFLVWKENKINELQEKIQELYLKVIEVYVNDKSRELNQEIIQTYRKLAVEEKDLLDQINDEVQ